MCSRVFGLLAVALVGVGACAQGGLRMSEEAQTSEPPLEGGIRGVWTVTELASRVQGAGWEIRGTPYLSQFIFTEEHYSYMYVPGPNARKKFAGDPNNPTDSEKAEAYNSVVAATGRYSLSGQTLTLNALLHKNPNEMGGTSLTYTVDVDGNSLQLVIANPPFMPGREWRMMLKRVD